MESLLKGEIQAFLFLKEDQRNRYYERDIGTRYEKKNDLRAAEIDEKWSLRSLRGFYKCMDEIREMFQERYPL